MLFTHTHTNVSTENIRIKKYSLTLVGGEVNKKKK